MSRETYPPRVLSVPPGVLMPGRQYHVDPAGSRWTAGKGRGALRWEADSLRCPLAIRFAAMRTTSHKTTLWDTSPGIRRETVSRYDRLRQRKPAISTPGSDPPIESGRKSRCEPFRDLIEQRLEQGLTAQRIFQDLKLETGFTGSYSSVILSSRRALQARIRL